MSTAKAAKQRIAGRPPRGEGRLSHERILRAARNLIEKGGAESLSLRATARKLRVDPMSLYTYYNGRSALIRALVEDAFSRVKMPRSSGRWKNELSSFALSYVRKASTNRALILAMIQDPAAAAGLAEKWNAALAACLAASGLRNSDSRPAIHALIDLLNGYALAGPMSPAGLRSELGILFSGIEVRMERS